MMANMSPLKKFPDSETFRDIALETGIDPAFIEKDWYAVQLIKAIAEINASSETQAIFSGGTSLSKGYDLIKRFSEDLDFIVTTLEGQAHSQGQRRSYRKNLLTDIQNSNTAFEIDESVVMRGDRYRFFKAPLTYPKTFEHNSLRPELQLEMTFEKPRLAPNQCQIQSIASQILKQDAETEIACLSATKTAANKLSALSWRVLVRQRDHEKDDPTMIRHLHDLAVLESVICQDRDSFVTVMDATFEQDRLRRGGPDIEQLTAGERIQKALDILDNDSLYRNEYETFVLNMSYADDSEHISFDVALEKLRHITDLYI